MNASSNPSPPDPRELVLEAYRRAKASGKPDWDRMRTAVLKNRLLDITNRTFDERAWGASTFREFVEGLGDLLEVDTSSTPVVLVLQPGAKAELGDADTGTAIGPRGRIRSDLWHGVLDFTGSAGWVWDVDESRAIAVEDLNATEPEARMPTVEPEELLGWRASFVADHADLFEDTASDPRIQRWRSGEGGAEQLPSSVRHVWFEFLKVQVLERLTTWFAERGIQPPADIVRSAPVKRGGDDEHQDLREFVIACVRQMTAEELAAVALPARVVLRARRLK
jgi:hypothetical protein